MRIKERFGWKGTATAVVALGFFAVCTWHGEDAAPERTAAAEPDLFSFVRPMAIMRFGSTTQVISQAAGGESLVVNLELRYWFDSLLSGAGEKTENALRAEMELEIDRRFAAVDAAEARRLLARYTDYRKTVLMAEMNAPEPAATPLTAARARQDTVRQTRAKYFTRTEAQDLFGLDDAAETAALARLEIILDPLLDAGQKRDKIVVLNEALSRRVNEISARKEEKYSKESGDKRVMRETPLRHP